MDDLFDGHGHVQYTTQSIYSIYIIVIYSGLNVKQNEWLNLSAIWRSRTFYSIYQYSGRASTQANIKQF